MKFLFSPSSRHSPYSIIGVLPQLIFVKRRCLTRLRISSLPRLSHSSLAQARFQTSSAEGVPNMISHNQISWVVCDSDCLWFISRDRSSFGLCIDSFLPCSAKESRVSFNRCQLHRLGASSKYSGEVFFSRRE